MNSWHQHGAGIHTLSISNPHCVVAPLVKIKQAILNIKKDITQMDIRTGVLEHQILQAKLKDKSNNAHSSGIEVGADDWVILCCVINSRVVVQICKQRW